LPREFSRTKRVGDQIQRDLAQLIQKEIKDPRVGMVTVTAVEVTKEYEKAKVFVTTFGDSNATKETVDALNQAAGYLRKQLGSRLTVRRVPQLNFVHDVSVEQGNNLSALINKAVASDKQNDE